MEQQYRERIIEESAHLFLKYGIRAVTMDFLANEMGISKRTIYEIFRDKDDLLYAVFIYMGEKQMASIIPMIERSETVIHAVFELLDIIGNHMRQINPLFFEDLKKYHHGVDKKLEGKRFDTDMSITMNIVERGVKEGLFRNNINKNLVNRALHGIFMITGDFNLFPKEEFSRQEVVKDFFLNYLRGISTTKGLSLINICEQETLK